MQHLKIISQIRHSHWLCLIFLLFQFKATCQFNLVKNGNFEDYLVCPNATIPGVLKDWYKPTNANYAYYANACSPDICCGVPYNYTGNLSYQFARSGNGYLLLSYYTKFFAERRTYAQIKLIDSLKKGKKYYAEYYVSFPNGSRYSSNNIGLLLSSGAIFQDTTSDPEGIIQANPQILGYNNPIITDTVNWVKINGIYKAIGGEQYITLGNFKKDIDTKLIEYSYNLSGLEAGYYIEDVSLIPLDSICLKADAGKDITIQQGDSAFIGSYTNGLDSVKWFANGTALIDSIRPGFWVKPTVTTSYVLQQNINGCFSADTVVVNVGTVPLQFLSFSISPSLQGGVRGGWTTANEINVSHFNIQRSTNSKDFITIGKVAAKNNNINNYEFIDNKLPITIDQLTIYYRLQSIDKDGSKQYSTTQQITIKPQTPNSISIYPNPANDYVNILANENIKETKIINQLGQVLQHQTPNAKQLTINTKQFIKGVYIIQATLQNGTIQNKKIIIQ